MLFKERGEYKVSGQALSFAWCSEGQSAFSRRRLAGEILHYIRHDKAMALSVQGVRYHSRHIYEKLQVNSRSEAVSKGLE